MLDSLRCDSLGTNLFALIHIISETATHASRLRELCRLLARALPADTVSLHVLRQQASGITVVHTASSVAVENPPPAFFEFAAAAIPQLPSANVVAHEISGDTSQHRWMVAAITPATWVSLDVATSSQSLRADVVDALVLHISRVMRASMLWSDSASRWGAPFDALTPREWEVLRALHSSEPEKQIADRMQLSAHTFHVHVKKIYRKLGVRSRLCLIELCRSAENLQLVSGASITTYTPGSRSARRSASECHVVAHA